MTYEKQRREYQKRNVLFWGLFAGYIPVVVIVGIPLGRVFDFKEMPGLIALAWMLAFGIVGIYRTMWKCPRCHKRFYYKWWYHNAFTRKCLHCGFRPAEK